MPFIDTPSGVYKIERQLPGYGKLRRTSLGTTNRRDAHALEAAILETHRRGLYNPDLFRLLDELQGRGKGRPGRISAQDLLVATKHLSGADVGLAQLLQSLNDPPLRDMVRQRVGGDSRTDTTALPAVEAAAEAIHGPLCPVSVLRDASHVTAILHRVEADSGAVTGRTKLPGSVVRWEKRAISRLLTDLYGRAERDRVMKDVNYSAGDDRRRLRESVVTQDAVARLLDAMRTGYVKPGDEAAPLYVQLCCATGATVSPLSRTRLDQWSAETGVIYLTGTKRSKGSGAARSGRDRDVQVPPQLVPAVETFAALARASDAETLFPLIYSRFGTMWKRAVKRAQLTEAVVNGRGELVPMRPHDLRRVFALFASRSGVSRDKVGIAGLGHDDLSTTDRYVRSQTRITSAEAAGVADALGF